ncbi:hypothetical protein AKJ37_02155 [candidate division MSBL1 archaeon SCGC-AAA259I09]|uniref:Uncharacterized protein n=2 Tax=candidate division MSBL1 TaxID=215777 RepID=A0A133UUM1_9EURY|nr:hypothetical protein AKJ62_02005 [candidate division MSBL1 archaeon SCGC-AAA259D14]KXA97849.1 hypothetical protein AKJ37_02155 [candidate division MSBL1 archaeon SCGC-AAA259I09]
MHYPVSELRSSKGAERTAPVLPPTLFRRVGQIFLPPIFSSGYVAKRPVKVTGNRTTGTKKANVIKETGFFHAAVPEAAMKRPLVKKGPARHEHPGVSREEARKPEELRTLRQTRGKVRMNRPGIRRKTDDEPQ